jgi:formamidopyrimidine-DNA glycosylase
MPELPEVEVVRRGVAERAVGRRVIAFVARRPDLRWPVPVEPARALPGRTLLAVERRSKYLLLRFEPGSLIVHLGMSGTFTWVTPDAPLRTHDHVDLALEGGVLRLNDPRRFGAVLWHPAQAGDPNTHPLLANLGVEPFSQTFCGRWLHQSTRGRRGSIKSVLLSGAIVVGVGNIYACESLFRAGIRPTLAAGRLSLARCERLAEEIRKTLAEAIDAGGSSLKDFVATDGHRGQFQLVSQVYGRGGQTCLRCAATVRRRLQQQRSTYWCPGCQR